MPASPIDHLVDVATWIGLGTTVCIFTFGLLLYLWKLKHGYNQYRQLADRFKTRPRRRSQRELRELAQGRSVALGRIVGLWPAQPLIVPESARPFNASIFAPTGAGKTTQILSTYLDADLHHPDVSLIIFDGQHALTESVLALAAVHHREVVIFPEVGFNPLRGPRSAEGNAAIFADVFEQIMQPRAGTPAVHYTMLAQSFIRKAVPLYERAYGQPMILRELLALCQHETLRKRLLADAIGTPEAREFSDFFGGWSSEKFEKSLAGLVNFLDQLCIERGKWLYNQRQAPTLMECVQQGKVALIREGGEPQTHDHTHGLLYMMLLQEYVKRRRVTPSSPLVSLYLDEAHFYLNPNFPNFLATTRKSLVAQHLGFQSLNQLKPYTSEIISNCRTWIIHGGLEAGDAEFVARNIGQRRFTEQTWTYQRTTAPRRTYAQRMDTLVPPHEIRGMPENRALVLTVDGKRREIAAHAFVEKPPPLQLSTVPYEEPQVPLVAPPTIWEQRDQQQAGVSGRTVQRQGSGW